MWGWIFGKPSPQADEAITDALEERDESSDEPEFITRAEQIRREEAALKESLKSSGNSGGGDAIETDPPVEEKPFKLFIFF